MPYSFIVWSFSSVGWFNIVRFLMGEVWLLQGRRRIVVIGATQIFVVRTRSLWLGLDSELFVEGAFQNRLQTLIGTSLKLESPLAGSFQPLGRVGFSKTHDAERSAITHLRMRLAFEDCADHLSRRRTHSFGPVNQA